TSSLKSLKKITLIRNIHPGSLFFGQSSIRIATLLLRCFSRLPIKWYALLLKILSRTVCLLWQVVLAATSLALPASRILSMLKRESASTRAFQEFLMRHASGFGFHQSADGLRLKGTILRENQSSRLFCLHVMLR